MNAHLIQHTVLGHTLYFVVLNNDDVLKPYKHHTAVSVPDIDGAFDVAASHNAPLLQNGKELLQGNFQ